MLHRGRYANLRQARRELEPASSDCVVVCCSCNSSMCQAGPKSVRAPVADSPRDSGLWETYPAEPAARGIQMRVVGVRYPPQIMSSFRQGLCASPKLFRAKKTHRLGGPQLSASGMVALGEGRGGGALWQVVLPLFSMGVCRYHASFNCGPSTGLTTPIRAVPITHYAQIPPLLVCSRSKLEQLSRPRQC